MSDSFLSVSEFHWEGSPQPQTSVFPGQSSGMPGYFQQQQLQQQQQQQQQTQTTTMGYNTTMTNPNLGNFLPSQNSLFSSTFNQSFPTQQSMLLSTPQQPTQQRPVFPSLASVNNNANASRWHNEAMDRPMRNQITLQILNEVQSLRPDLGHNPKLLQMAKALEDHLYRIASSRSEYMNVSTLRDRLHNIADDLDTHRRAVAARNQSVLRGNFSWQSNADLPARREVIYSIFNIIQQMSPNASSTEHAHRVPHMAKSLEEHLYKSAKTKADYLNPSTLESRLRMIASNLDAHYRTKEQQRAQASM